MYYFYGLKVNEIAEIMECSTGTVKSRLNYARKEIQRQIEEKRKKGITFPAIIPLPAISHIINEGIELAKPSEHVIEAMSDNVSKMTGKNSFVRTMHATPDAKTCNDDALENYDRRGCNYGSGRRCNFRDYKV